MCRVVGAYAGGGPRVLHNLEVHKGEAQGFRGDGLRSRRKTWRASSFAPTTSTSSAKFPQSLLDRRGMDLSSPPGKVPVLLSPAMLLTPRFSSRPAWFVFSSTGTRA